MGVGEELGGILLDLLDGETLTRVLAVGDNTSSEGALETANAASASLITDRVGESDSRFHKSVSQTLASPHQKVFLHVPGRSRLALLSLVDVSGSVGGGLEVAAEAKEGDVVADDVLVGVDAVLEDSVGVGEATGELVLRVDDLVGGGFDVVDGGEVEGNSLSLPALAADADVDESPLVVVDGSGLRDGAKGEGSESELHFDGGVVGGGVD